jgi:hypothetical protein
MLMSGKCSNNAAGSGSIGHDKALAQLGDEAWRGGALLRLLHDSIFN